MCHLFIIPAGMVGYRTQILNAIFVNYRESGNMSYKFNIDFINSTCRQGRRKRRIGEGRGRVTILGEYIIIEIAIGTIAINIIISE